LIVKEVLVFINQEEESFANELGQSANLSEKNVYRCPLQGKGRKVAWFDVVDIGL
jgi:hypothetical protein